MAGRPDKKRKAPAILGSCLKTPGMMVIAPGAYDGISARLIAEAGFDAVYMTGAGTAASRIGQPDLGLITLTEMVANAAAIAECTGLPVIADADTGYGNPLNVIRTVREYERAGVAAIHLEDQTFPKRCGHMEGKQVVPAEEFVQKIKAACDARRNGDFLIIARTDARTVLGFDEAVRRGNLYAEAGADVVFIESPLTVEEMAGIPKLIKAPCLVNMAGPASRSPALASNELRKMGYKIAIHPAVAMDAVVTGIRRALNRLKDEGISWDPENVVGPHKFFEAMGLEVWRAREKMYSLKGEDS
jgi:2-methylisocitrate lyase-like PEP mutase family enzyme